MKDKKDLPSVSFILKAVALAMGIASLVLFILSEADERALFGMLSIGLICLALASLDQYNKK